MNDPRVESPKWIQVYLYDDAFCSIQVDSWTGGDTVSLGSLEGMEVLGKDLIEILKNLERAVWLGQQDKIDLL